MSWIEGAAVMNRGFVVVRAYRVVWLGMTAIYGCCENITNYYKPRREIGERGVG